MLSIADDETPATLGPAPEPEGAADPGAGSSSEPRVLPDPRNALDEPAADSFACRPLPPLIASAYITGGQAENVLGGLLEDIRHEALVTFLAWSIGVLNG